MNVITNENIVLCDVDQTLWKWGKDHMKPGKGKIKVQDPYSKDYVFLRPHKVHVRLLKQYASRGYYVIVASMAGVKWAKTAVEVLGLTEYVGLVMAKPVKHIDDQVDVKHIVGARVFLEDGD